MFYRHGCNASLLALTAGLSLLMTAASARAITIARDGQPKAVIVVPAGDQPAGAADLQRHIENVSGAKLEIVREDRLVQTKAGGHVFVGPCVAASRVVDVKRIEPEGFVIKTAGDDLFIVGRDQTETGMAVAGTFYGVCEFLERYLGVRWLMPGPLGEVAPRQGTIEIASADIRQEPVLCLRGSVPQRVAADQSFNGYAYSIYQSGPVRDYPDHSDNLIIGYVGFDSEEYLNDTARAAQHEDWLKWSKLTKHLFFRPNLLLQPISLPIIYTHKLAEDLRFMADHGMWGATFGSGSGGNWGTQGLDYYVLVKLLWDPRREVDPIVEDYCRAAYGPGAEAMEEYYRRAEELTNRMAAAGKPNRDLDMRIEKRRNKLTDPYTDAELAGLQACVDKAAAAIGASDAAALERVRLVATGLDYTRKTRDLLAAAAAVRAGRSTREEFNRIKAETDTYYASLSGSLAVKVSRDVQSCLSLTPDRQRQMPGD